MPLAKDGCVDLVDPFIGTEAIDLPRPEGIAASWFYLKAQIGNTHPGACLPFSPVSACPYSGAYVTGYGRYDVNTHGSPPRLYDAKGAFGVSHVHHSGTGYIDSFYNYLLAVPYRGAAPSLPAVDLLQSRPFPLSGEKARPGSYAGRLDGIDVALELAAAPGAAAHRYSFGTAGGGVAVDVTNAGLAPRRARARAEAASLALRDDGVCAGSMVHCGVRWYFAIVCPRRAETTLWRGPADGDGAQPPSGLVTAALLDGRELALDRAACAEARAGVCFRTPGTDPLLLYVGLSVGSEAVALRSAERAAARGFDGTAADAEALWEEHLGRVRVSGGDDRQRRIFTTALYHSLLKPVETEPDNFLWRGGPSLYADFATMWDQYKTQLPLVFTLCPERILPIVRSLVAVEKAVGFLPPGLIFDTHYDRFMNQSRALAVVVLKDAFDRTGPDGSRPRAAWDDALRAMARSLERDARSIRPGEQQSYSHLLDVAYGAFCTGSMAAELGRAEPLARAAELSGSWREAFDPATGLMKRAAYYEAGHVSYSFRLLHDMASRIALAGGRDRFLARLDAFFGYGAEPVAQLREPPWDAARRAGLALGRFDGVNNEVALETPYAYAYAGLPDRTAEVVDAVRRYQYGDTAGGLPGNDDSGALSSWFVWSALGLYPVPGQGIFLVGSPAFEEAEVVVGARRFSIRARKTAGGAIYLASIRLDGTPLRRSYLRYEEVLSGGTLEVDLAESPGAFVPDELPPSHASPGAGLRRGGV